jgi:hypothetical protein
VDQVQRRPTSIVLFSHSLQQKKKPCELLVVHQNNPLGEHRLTALKDSLDTISSILGFTSGVNKVKFLKVA